METKVLDGIPVIEYDDENHPFYHGVVFLIHGHTGNKELWGLEKVPQGFLKRGYFVVSVDAYKHGDRMEYPYQTNNGLLKTIAMLEVVSHTTQDIIHLYEKYYQKYSEKFLVFGTSMGGHICYQIPRFYQNVEMIMPMIGTPDLESHYKKTKASILGDRINECVSSLESLKINDLDSFLNVKMICFNGAIDPVVETKYVTPFIEELKKKNHPNLDYEIFQSAHLVTEEMVNRLFKVFDQMME